MERGLGRCCKPVPATLPWWTTYGLPPSAIVTTVCSGTISAAHMLNYTAFSVVFMVVSIAGEAASIAQTVIRPITSALHTGFNKVAQLGNAGAGSSSEATGWVNAMDFGRQTQRLGNLGTDGGQRVPAPKDVRGTSVMPSRAPNTTPMSPGTARYESPNTSTTAMVKATSKI
jgi:hypothetical protein